MSPVGWDSCSPFRGNADKIHSVSVMPLRMEPLDALACCFSYCQLASRWKRNWVSRALVPCAPERAWDCSQISGGETF